MLSRKRLGSFICMSGGTNGNALARWLREMLALVHRAPRRGQLIAPAVKPVGRYDAMVQLMKERHGISVRRWRNSTTGCAWQTTYGDGTVRRWIESPYPKGPMSAAVFLHEVGHHAIGFNRYKPRCLEEYMAWQWALNAMNELGIVITPRVRLRVEHALRYAVAKAKRRGIRRVPMELVKYAG